MEIEFNSSSGALCFRHAVKAVIEDDENVTASAPDISHSDMGGTGYLGQTCCRCFPEVSPEDQTKIFDYLRADRKAQAIRWYKDEFRTDLKSAKIAIDGYQDMLRWEEEDEV